MSDPRPHAAVPGRRPAPADLLTLVAIAVPAASHLRFVQLDTRFPRDLGLYYKALPDIWGSFAVPGEAVGQAIGTLLQPGGWYQLALALWLRLVGRGPDTFQLVDVAWLVAIGALTAAIARRRGGPLAGAAAACLVGAFPAVFVHARTAWIHVPEAALLLIAVWAWWVDPGWRRRWTLALAAIAGAAALALRPSALVWMGLLAAAMGARLWRGDEPRRGRRWGALAAVWAVGTLPVLLALPGYLEAKVAAREHYAVIVPGVLHQLLELTGPLPLLVVTAGLVGTAWPRRGGRPDAARGSRAPAGGAGARGAGGVGVALLGVWTATPVALFALFRAGMDNFTVALAAAAALAGVGLARRPRLGLIAAALALAAMQLPQWLPPAGRGTAGWEILRALRLPAEETFRNSYRPYRGGHPRDVLAVLDATCPEPGAGCRVAVDQGLFQPYTEDPGELELFLAGYDHVRIERLAGRPRIDDVPSVHGMSHYDCGGLDEPWRTRYPGSLGYFMDLGQQQDLRPSWSKKVDQECAWLWFTPRGMLRRPEALPAGGDLLRPPKGPRDGGRGKPPPGTPTGEEVDPTVRAVENALFRLLDEEASVEDLPHFEALVARFAAGRGDTSPAIVAARSDDGLRFTRDPGPPLLRRAAAPAAAVDDEGRVHLFYVDTDLDAWLPMVRERPGWFATHGIPGVGALRLAIVDDDGRVVEVEEFGIDGMVRGAVRAPDVARMPDGSWRMVYVGVPYPRLARDEEHLGEWAEEVFVASSDDLVHWTQQGRVLQGPLDGPTLHCATRRDCLLLGDGLSSATSTDGGLLFDYVGRWSRAGAGPSLLSLPDGSLRAYYATTDDPPLISSLRSTDGERWSREAGARLEAGAGGAPTVVFVPGKGAEGGEYRMFLEVDEGGEDGE